MGGSGQLHGGFGQPAKQQRIAAKSGVEHRHVRCAPDRSLVSLSGALPCQPSYFSQDLVFGDFVKMVTRQGVQCTARTPPYFSIE